MTTSQTHIRIPSGSRAGVEHSLKLQASGIWTCTCEAFRFRGRCPHQAQAQAASQTPDPAPPACLRCHQSVKPLYAGICGNCLPTGRTKTPSPVGLTCQQCRQTIRASLTPAGLCITCHLDALDKMGGGIYIPAESC